MCVQAERAGEGAACVRARVRRRVLRGMVVVVGKRGKAAAARQCVVVVVRGARGGRGKGR